MRFLRRLLWAALFVALLILGWNFRIANDITVHFDYLIGHTEGLPLWKLVLGAFFAGALLATIPLVWMLARAGLLSRRYRKAVSRLEGEVHELRTLPLGVEGAPRPAATDATPTTAALRSGRGS